jgi:hypothetical protein
VQTCYTAADPAARTFYPISLPQQDRLHARGTPAWKCRQHPGSSEKERFRRGPDAGSPRGGTRRGGGAR